MTDDFDQFGRELTLRLNRLLIEFKRLTEENERLLLEKKNLLQENKELRAEVTLARLHSELGAGADLPFELKTEAPPEPMLSPEALAFYRNLPRKINFSDFFRHAEAAELSGARAREFMLSFFRQGLLQQRGRRLEKSAIESPPRCREIQSA